MQLVLSINSSFAQASVSRAFDAGKSKSSTNSTNTPTLVARFTPAPKCRTIKANGCGCQTATTQKIRTFDVLDFDFDLTGLLSEGDKVTKCEATTSQVKNLACLAAGKVAKVWVQIHDKKEDRFTLRAESEYGVRKEFLVILRVE